MSDSPPPNNITPEKGRTAWVHIGCEKTGTSSIQKFLLENQQTLTSEGLYFPIECGLLSNHRLHWIIEDNPDHHPFIYDPKSGLGDCLNAGREKITEEHYSKVKAFQRDHTHGSHVVYSSEHLHSRVYDPQVIQNLKDWLSPLYDRIKVVVYLRRQDKLVLSAYSTHLRGGTTDTFIFPSAGTGSPYFGYRRLIDQWSDVFGKSDILIRQFEKTQLYKENIVDDFGNLVGFDFSSSIYEQPRKSNMSLSHAAKLCLIRINRKIADPRSAGSGTGSWLPLKEDFIKFVESNIKTADKDTDLATRTDARDFYNRFANDNEKLFSDYQVGWNFSEDFTMYRESKITVLSELLADNEKSQDIKACSEAHNDAATIRKQASEIVEKFASNTSQENQALIHSLNLI